MQVFKTSAALSVSFLALTAFVGGSPAAAAGSAFCPGLVNQPVTESSTSGSFNGVVTYSGFQLQNGQCTNAGASGQDPAAFSGAALASQALSELTQSSTQETARSAQSSIANRRDQEQQSCASGFARVNGECERIAAPVAEARPAPPPEPAAAAERPRKKAKAARAVAAEEEAPAPRAGRKAAKASRTAAKAPPPSAYVAPRPIVSKDGPPPPIEAPFRYGVWGQAYGEYERRDATAPTSIVGPDFNAGLPVALTTSVTSKSGTFGFQAGADVTTRGLIAPGDGIIAGVLVGFVANNLTLNTTTASSNFSVVGNSTSYLTARLNGPTVGVYATYFSGGFSTDLLAKFDILTLNQNFTDNLAYAGPQPGPFFTSFSGSGSASLFNSTVAANLNYRFDIAPNLFFQPTVGAQFTALSYGGGAAELALADGQQVMIQGGARIGTTAAYNNILLTTTLTGLAYDDVVVNGGFIAGASFNGNNILADADRGQVRGRGLLALNADFGQGVTSFIQGDVHGGRGLFGAGGRAGIRYQW